MLTKVSIAARREGGGGDAAMAIEGDTVVLGVHSVLPIEIPTVQMIDSARVRVEGASPGTSFEAFADVTSTAPRANGPAAFVVTFRSPGATSICGNVVTATTDDSRVVVDRVPPAVTAVALRSSNDHPRFAKVGDVLTLSFSADEDVRVPAVTILDSAAAVQPDPAGQQKDWTATATVPSGAPAGVARFRIAPLRDVAGNAAAAETTRTTDSADVIIDTVAPLALTMLTMTSSNAQNPQLAKAGDTVTLMLSANEDLTVTSVTLCGDVALAAEGDGEGSEGGVDVSASSGAKAFSVVVAAEGASAAAADGACQLSVRYVDAAGNPAQPQTETLDGSAVTIDTTPPEAPTIESITSSNEYDASQATLGDTVTVVLSFHEDLAAAPEVEIGSAGQSHGGGTRRATVTQRASMSSFAAKATINTLFEHGFDVAVRAVRFADAAGNVGDDPSPVRVAADGSSVAVDTQAPASLASVSIASSHAEDPSRVWPGESITLTVDAGEETLRCSTIRVQIAGADATPSWTGCTETPTLTQFQASVTVTDETEDGPVDFSIVFADAVGNEGAPVDATTDGSAVTVGRPLWDEDWFRIVVPVGSVLCVVLAVAGYRSCVKSKERARRDIEQQDATAAELHARDAEIGRLHEDSQRQRAMVEAAMQRVHVQSAQKEDRLLAEIEDLREELQKPPVRTLPPASALQRKGLLRSMSDSRLAIRLAPLSGKAVNVAKSTPRKRKHKPPPSAPGPRAADDLVRPFLDTGDKDKVGEEDAPARRGRTPSPLRMRATLPPLLNSSTKPKTVLPGTVSPPRRITAGPRIIRAPSAAKTRTLGSGDHASGSFSAPDGAGPYVSGFALTDKLSVRKKTSGKEEGGEIRGARPVALPGTPVYVVPKGKRKREDISATPASSGGRSPMTAEGTPVYVDTNGSIETRDARPTYPGSPVYVSGSGLKRESSSGNNTEAAATSPVHSRVAGLKPTVLTFSKDDKVLYTRGKDGGHTLLKREPKS